MDALEGKPRHRPGVAAGGAVPSRRQPRHRRNIPRAQEKAFTQHAVARLLQWLATPADGPTDLTGAVEQLQRNALWLGF
jgi:hypothetical protein